MSRPYFGRTGTNLLWVRECYNQFNNYVVSGGGCPGCPRQSYATMAGKPAPSSHEPPCQCSQAPVTLIYQWKNKAGRDGGKRMIQRLNEESGRQENAVLSTWS